MMDAWRSSSFPTYESCGRMWAADHIPNEIMARDYKLGEKRTHIGAFAGTGTHRGRAYFLDELASSGTLGGAPRRNAAVEVGIVSLEEALAEGDPVYDPVTPRDDAKDAVKRMTLQAIAAINEDDHPVLVEDRLKAVLDGKVMITGTLDLYLLAQFLNDLKTGKQAPFTKYTGQIGSYVFIAEANNLPVKQAGYDFVQRVRKSAVQPAVQRKLIDIPAAKRQAASIATHITRDVAEFRRTGRRDAFLARPSSYLCRPEFCRACHKLGPKGWCPESANGGAADG